MNFRTSRMFRVALMLSGALCVPAAAQAQLGAQSGAQAQPAAGSGAAVSDAGGEEIVVTAQRRSQTLSDVPISVTAQTGEQLVQKGISDVQDLVKVTPGLSSAESGRGVPVFSLRGVGFFEQAIGGRPTVSVYLDEAPIPFSVEAAGVSFDLERVEVLKGPQGTLFGQSSTGGAINYIAAKPRDTFEAGLIGSYGRFNSVDLQGYVTGSLSPTLAARLAVRTRQGGDWQRSYTRNDKRGAQDFTQARLLLDWKPTERLWVAININGFHDASDMQAPQFIGYRRASPVIQNLVNYPVAPPDPRAADWDSGKDYVRNNKFIQATGRIDYRISSAFRVISLTSYSHEDVYQFSDGDGTTVTNYDPRVTGSLESISQELRLSGEVGRLNVLVGASYGRDRTSESNEIILPYSLNARLSVTPIPFDHPATSSNQRFETYAAFTDLTYRLTDRVRLTGGVRYTKQNLDYNGCLYVFNQSSADAYTVQLNVLRARAGLGSIVPLVPGQCASVDNNLNPTRAFGTLDEDNVSWRGVLDFKPTPRTLLYASVSKGYKAGSAPAPAATSNAQFLPVRQESVLAYEAGLKTSLFDRRVDFSTAAFYYDYRDKQLLGRNIFTPNIFGPVSALVNIPKSRVYGWEGQLTVRPTRGLSLTGAATYIDTKVKGPFLNYDIVGTQYDFGEEAFPYTPKWQVVLDGDYLFPMTGKLTGTIGANANYRTSTVAGFGNDARLKIDSYWLVDLRAGVESPDGAWRVQLYGRNIFNEYYWNNVSASVDNIRRYAGMPATYGVQVGLKFR